MMAAKLPLLIVEDDHYVEKLLLQLANRLGYNAVSFNNLQEATEWLNAYSPAAVLIDIHLPDGKSYPLMEKLSTKYPETPLISMSSKADSQTRQAAITAGADAFLPKPFTPGEVQTLLAENMPSA